MRCVTYLKEQSDGMRRAALVRARIGKEKKADSSKDQLHELNKESIV
jgi:hypothetical protein